MIYSLKNRKLLFLLLLCVLPFWMQAQSNHKEKRYSIKKIEEIARPFIDSMNSITPKSRGRVYVIGINNLKKRCVSFYVSDIEEKTSIYKNDQTYYYYYDKNNELILVRISPENIVKLTEKLNPWVNSEQIIDSLVEKRKLTEVEITGGSIVGLYILKGEKVYQKTAIGGFVPNELSYGDRHNRDFKYYSGDSRKMFEDFMKIYYKCGCGDK